MIWIITIVWIVFVVAIIAYVASGADRNPSVKKDDYRADRFHIKLNEDGKINVKFSKKMDEYEGNSHAHRKDYEAASSRVVLENPEEGYVILNGVKRRIEDCKYL